jgi:rod shape-determining protein MreC
VDAGSKNRAMETELRQNRAQLMEAKATARENYRLKRLARLIESNPSAIVSARLIASTGASTRRYATLSAGSAQGVAGGQPVRTSEGLIGRVIATGRVTARVLLITDGGAVIPVRRLSDGVPALATGRGDGGLDIRALQAGSNPFQVGDVFVTGAGGIYPPDVPVALAKVQRRDMTIARPLADPARLDFAIVLPPFVAPDPVLPPEPVVP